MKREGVAQRLLQQSRSHPQTHSVGTLSWKRNKKFSHLNIRQNAKIINLLFYARFLQTAVLHFTSSYLKILKFMHYYFPTQLGN